MKSRSTRAADRPHDGDTRPCPFCRTLMYFHDAKSKDAAPGWYCGCGYRILPPSPTKQSTAEMRRALTERRANAFRKSMKVRAQAHRLIKKSQRITTGRETK